MGFLSGLLVYLFCLVILAVLGCLGYVTNVDDIEATAKEIRKNYADIDFKKYPKTASLLNAKQNPDTDAQRYQSLMVGVTLVYAITILPIAVFLANLLTWVTALAAGIGISLALIYLFCTRDPKKNLFLLQFQKQAQAVQMLIDRYKSLPQSKIDEALDIPLPNEATMIEKLKDVNTLITLSRSHTAAKDKAVERLKNVEELSSSHPLIAEENVDVTSK